MTIADVARAAGVSRTTVSHVLTGNRPVAPATQRLVREKMGALGFRPNSLARSLRTRRSHTVALIVADIRNPYYPVLARGLQDLVSAAGYHVFISNTDAKAEMEKELLDDVVERCVDAIAIEAFELDEETIRAAVPEDVPLVLIGPSVDGRDIDRVTIDDESGAYAAATLLAGLDHERIASISGPRRHSASRIAAFRRGLERNGVNIDDALLAEADWTLAGGATAMQRLLDVDDPPTAVFCANDLMAVGAMEAIRSRGLRVPEDVSVVGFDNIEAAALVTPALTTVQNPGYESGRAAGDLLLERLASRDGSTPRRLVLPCSLIERASVAARRRQALKLA